jgi:HD-GYP domain-containing protein (c-di-GMP phosphodiesterase class II)
MTKAEARKIIEEVAGTQLDPKVVKAFLAIESLLKPEEAETQLLYAI